MLQAFYGLCAGLSKLVLPIHMQIGDGKHTHYHFALLYVSAYPGRGSYPRRRSMNIEMTSKIYIDKSTLLLSHAQEESK